MGSAPGARLLSRDWNSNLLLPPPPPPWAGLPGLLLLLPPLVAAAPSGRPSTFLRGLGIAADGPDPSTRPAEKQDPSPATSSASALPS